MMQEFAGGSRTPETPTGSIQNAGEIIKTAVKIW